MLVSGERLPIAGCVYGVVRAIGSSKYNAGNRDAFLGRWDIGRAFNRRVSVP
jgi:hypothetical protein